MALSGLAMAITGLAAMNSLPIGLYPTGPLVAVAAHDAAPEWPAAGSAWAGALAVSGQWRTHDGNAVVTIEDCGDGTPCGIAENGATILRGFAPAESRWHRGDLVNPDTGRHYRSAVRRLSPTEIEVKGCVGPVCKDLIWVSVTLQGSGPIN